MFYKRESLRSVEVMEIFSQRGIGLQKRDSICIGRKAESCGKMTRDRAKGRK